MSNTTNIASMTPAQLKKYIQALADSNPDVAKALESTSPDQFVTSTVTKSDILIEKATGQGLLDRGELMAMIGEEGAGADPKSEEYRTSSKNLASHLTAVRKKLGMRVFKDPMTEKIAILNDDQLAAYKDFIDSLNVIENEVEEDK